MGYNIEVTLGSSVRMFAPVWFLRPSTARPHGHVGEAHLGLLEVIVSSDPGQGAGPSTQAKGLGSSGPRPRPKDPGQGTWAKGLGLGASNLGQVPGPILAGPRPWPKGPGPWLLSHNLTPKVASCPPAGLVSNLGWCVCV